MRQNSGTKLLLWHSHLLLGLAGAFAIVWPFPACIASILVIVFNKNFHKLSCLLAGIAIFFATFISMDWLKNMRIAQYEKTCDWIQSSPRICASIASIQQFPENRWQILLSEASPENDSQAKPLPGYIRWMLHSPSDGFNPLPGQTVCLSRPILKQRGFINSADGPHNLIFARQQAWRIFSKGSQGDPTLLGTGSWPGMLRQKIKNEFLRLARLPQNGDQDISGQRFQGRAILLALLFGDRSYLSQQTVDNFIAGGLAHSLALSGQHLGIAALAALCLVFALGSIRPEIYLHRPRIILVALCSIPFALIYLWLGNAPASLLRAFCMLFFLAVWASRGKAWSGIDLVCAAVFALCCISPDVLFETGMHFSVICVLVIALIGPVIPDLPKAMRARLPSTIQKFAWRLWQIFFISLAIQLFLLPLALSHFTQASFLFPLNLLWLPVLGLFVLPCAFFALPLSLFSAAAASFLIDMAAQPCEWLLELLEFLRMRNFLEMPALLLPHWCNIFAYALLLCACACCFAKVKTRICASFGCFALLFLAVAPALRLFEISDGSPELSLIDVGQGQAILVKFDGCGQILIDGGGGAGSFDIGKQVVGAALARNFPPFLDAIVNSHPDMDHLGGLLSLASYFKNGFLFHNGHELENRIAYRWRKLKENENAHPLFANDVIHLGKPENGLKLEVLHPPAFAIPDSKGQRVAHPDYQGNNASIVLRLSRHDKGLAILTGDAEKKALKILANSGKKLQAKVLVASHHGSDTGLAPEFYRRVNPELVLASCGFQNRWGFPGKNLKRFLSDRNLPLLATSQYGRIDVRFDNDEEKLKIKSALSDLKSLREKQKVKN